MHGEIPDPHAGDFRFIRDEPPEPHPDECPACGADPCMCDEMDDDDEYYECGRCGGTGEIVTCIDDLCHGEDQCIHGDGYGPCPDCGGKG